MIETRLRRLRNMRAHVHLRVEVYAEIADLEAE